MKLKNLTSKIYTSPIFPGVVGKKTYNFFRKQSDIGEIAGKIDNSQLISKFNNLKNYKMAFIGVIAGFCTEAISYFPAWNSLNYLENNQVYTALSLATWSIALRFGIHNLFNGMGNNLETLISHHNEDKSNSP